MKKIWTEERAREAAAKCKTRTELKDKYYGAWKIAKQLGIRDEICSHMNVKKLPNGYWTKERVAEIMRPYKTVKEFRNAHGAAYGAAHKQGFWEELKPHFTPMKPDWSDRETVKAEVAKYASLYDLRTQASGLYSAIRTNDMWDLIQHFSRQISNPPWELEDLKAAAAPYTRRKDFQDAETGAYQSAWKRGLLDVICAHMDPPASGWSYTKEQAKQLALQFETRRELELAHKGAYYAIIRNGWHDLFGHMAPSATELKWTEDTIADEAKKYTRRQDFRTLSPGAYDAAHEKHIMDDVCSHMEYVVEQPNAIYIWRAKRHRFAGRDVYKIGITNLNQGTRRIIDVCRDGDIEAEIITIVQVENPRSVEKKLHQLGKNPEFSGFQGATEFRALSDSELETALGIIRAADNG